MKNIFFVLLFMPALLFSKSFEVDGLKFSFELPSDWKAIYGAKDLPLTILSKDQVNRTVISVIPSGQLGKELRVMMSQSVKDAYIKEKGVSLVQEGFSGVKYVKYDLEKTAAGEYLEAIFKFQKKSDAWVEVTHYRSCENKFFYIKAIYRDQKELELNTHKILGSFACKK